MNGYRFYLEYETPADKRKGEDEGNVVAVLVANGIFYSGNVACYEAIGATFFHPNSQVSSTAVSIDRLRTHTKRISEKRAREIHPNLFVYLDD